jgi:hypothetical protein
MDSKIFEIYIDRVTHIDLYAKTKNGIFKINVMLDKRGYIPEGILIQPNMMSIYEVKTQTVKYYENLGFTILIEGKIPQHDASGRFIAIYDYIMFGMYDEIIEKWKGLLQQKKK